MVATMMLLVICTVAVLFGPSYQYPLLRTHISTYAHTHLHQHPYPIKLFPTYSDSCLIGEDVDTKVETKVAAGLDTPTVVNVWYPLPLEYVFLL